MTEKVNVPNLISSVNTIQKFPKKIKKINYNKSLPLKLDISNILVINELNMFIIKKNSIVELFNSKFELYKVLKTTEEDHVNKFGYNYFVNDDLIYISGFSKNNIIFYGYDVNNFELKRKIKLDNIFGNFNIDIIKDVAIISILEKNELNLYHLDLLNNFKIIKIIKLDINSNNVKTSYTKNFKYIYSEDDNNGLLFILNSENQLIEKNTCNINFIETINICNNMFTIIGSDTIKIFDENNVLRQSIEQSNIDNAIFSNSYLFLINSKKSLIEVYALDNNGIFINFAKISNIDSNSKINVVDTTVLISSNVNSYVPLPFRIFDRENFQGYGFFTTLDYVVCVKNLKAIYLIDNKLTTIRKHPNEILVGFTSNLSNFLFEENKISLSYQKIDSINEVLLKDFLLISDDTKNEDNILDNKKPNFLFINENSIKLYFESEIGNSLEIKIDDKSNIIVFKESKLIKLNLENKNSIIELETNDIVKFLGYSIVRQGEKLEYNFNILTDDNDVILSDSFIKKNPTFIPFLKDNHVKAIKSLDFPYSDINIKFHPLERKLLKYSDITTIPISNNNHYFNKRYIITNDDKTLSIFDLFKMSEVTKLKLETISSINKIIYVNPLVLILCESNEGYDTNLSIMNVNNLSNIPYTISNNSKENLTNIFTVENNNLFFVTKSNKESILYIVKLDQFNEVEDMKKITFDKRIIKINVHNNLLGIWKEDNEVVLYDLETNNSFISFKDEQIIDFNIYENYFMSLLKSEDEFSLYIYTIKPNFEIYSKTQIKLNNAKNINFYNNVVIISNNDSYMIYTFDESNGLKFIQHVKEKIVHFYKNLIVTQVEKDYKIYRLSASLIYKENQINCGVEFEELEIVNNKDEKETYNLFVKVSDKTNIKINEQLYDFNNLVSKDSIVNFEITLPAKEEVKLECSKMDIKLCSVVNQKIYQKLPCFLPESLVKTPNGNIMIKDLKDSEYVYDQNGTEVKILRVNKWSTSLFTLDNIPYIIPKDSLEKNYPSIDTYVSPFHKIMLPNNDFVMVKDINLPFIKKFNNHTNQLKYKDTVLDEIVYYNLILENSSNFIVNNLVVESLNPNNPRIE